MRLVPARLGRRRPGATPARTTLAATGTVEGFLSAEPVAEALTEARPAVASATAGLAFAALLGELVLQLAPVHVYDAGQLVGGVGQVEGLVVLAAAVRVGEHGVRLL